MSSMDWKQWAMDTLDRLNWVEETIESAFGKFAEAEMEGCLECGSRRMLEAEKMADKGTRQL
jgi:hypothetical protein